MATIVPEISLSNLKKFLKNMGTAFGGRMALVTVSQAFSPCVVHLYGGTSAKVNVEWFNLALESFAKAVEAGNNKIILLVIEQAGWHMSEKVVVPEGIYLEPLPPYSPELQPAERLWQLSDEPLVNKSFDTLDQLEEVLAERCCIVSQMRSKVQALTNYHWWPDSDALLTG
jgi:transposase